MSASPQVIIAAGSQQLLATVWQRNLPLLRARLAHLESAAQLAETGLLPSATRQEAASIAHKLAGSLGMFGYLRGTEIARELEVLLDVPDAVDRYELRKLTSLLLQAVPV